MALLSAMRLVLPKGWQSALRLGRWWDRPSVMQWAPRMAPLSDLRLAWPKEPQTAQRSDWRLEQRLDWRWVRRWAITTVRRSGMRLEPR